MCDDYECEEYEDVTPERLTWADLAYAGLVFVQGVAESAVESARSLRTSVQLHSERVLQERAFAREAQSEMESLTGSEREDG